MRIMSRLTLKVLGFITVVNQIYSLACALNERRIHIDRVHSWSLGSAYGASKHQTKYNFNVKGPRDFLDISF